MHNRKGSVKPAALLLPDENLNTGNSKRRASNSRRQPPKHSDGIASLLNRTQVDLGRRRRIQSTNIRKQEYFTHNGREKRESEPRIQPKHTPLAGEIGVISPHLKDKLFPSRTRQDYIFETHLNNRSSSRAIAASTGGGKLAKKDRSQAYLMLERGKQYFNQSNTQRAIKCYGLSLELDPQLHESLYYMGMAHINMHNFLEASRCLRELVERYPSVCKKSAYVLLAVALKKLKRDAEALNYLARVIALYPGYEDAMVYRAKILLVRGDISQALQAFDQVLSSRPDNTVALIGKADLLRSSGKRKEAVAVYRKAVKAIESSDSRSSKVTQLYSDIANHHKGQAGAEGVYVGLLLKLVGCLVELGQLLQARQFLSELPAERRPGPCSELLYYEGIIRLGVQKQTNEAYALFQQSCLLNDNPRFVAKSLQQQLIVKIQERDFYDARHVLSKTKSRAELDKDEVIRLYEGFIEAVIYAMKRKFEDSAREFALLLPAVLPALLAKLVPLYAAYTAICEGRIPLAIQLYQKAGQQLAKRLDPSALHNLQVCRGIMSCRKKEYESAVQCFRRAHMHVKVNSQALLYEAVVLIEMAAHQSESGVQEQYYSRASEIVEEACHRNEANAGLHYVRALLMLRMGDLEASLDSIEKAIQKAEQNVAEYFHLRGLINFGQDKIGNAINDFSVSLSIQEDHLPSLISRAAANVKDLNFEDAFADFNTIFSPLLTRHRRQQQAGFEAALDRLHGK